MNFRNQSQIFAEKSYERIAAKPKDSTFSEYLSFARSFPSLVHTAGLAQAVTFAKAKNHDKGFLEDLIAVLYADPRYKNQSNQKVEAFINEIQKCNLDTYILLSRRAMIAAGWLKRYAEALQPAE